MIKKIKISLFILTIFAIYSCESTWYYEYVITNATGYNITIHAFDTDISPVLNSDIIKIDPHSEYSVLKANGYHADFQGIFSIGEVDSVIISFNNDKILTYTCEAKSGQACEYERNIMNFNNEADFIKTKRGKSDGHTEYCFTYTITEEDYNKAILIEE